MNQPDEDIDFSADAETGARSAITMTDMAEAARLLLHAEEETAAAEQALKDKKEAERKLREETIPGMFAELGVEKLVLSDGSTFTCKQEVYASIPADRREEAYAWCERNGFGGIIKTEVKVPFGKGELEKAMELVDKLVAELGVDNAIIDRSIHAQTLKAFLKERILAEQESVEILEGEIPPGELPADVPGEEGEDNTSIKVEKLDLDLFGARPVMTAAVKAPPKKKSYSRAVSSGGGKVHDA